MDEYSCDSDSDSCGELQIHIEEDEKLEIENDLAALKQIYGSSLPHIKETIDLINLPETNEKNEDSSKKSTHMVTRNRKTAKTPAKTRKNQNQENAKEEISDESDNSNLPEDCKILDKKLSISAEKNQLTDANIKNIIKRVVSNEHVLAIVKLREEELLNQDDNPQPKLTRAKTKELLKSHPTVKPPWPLPITPVKVPDIVSPEVSSLILQDLPEEESDEEYKPNLYDHESDDDKDTITSISDLDSLPKTPYTPGELESPIKYTDDGIFKMPRDINEFRSPGKVVDDEATIALRTRSKLCLSDTPIENIENCFVPPDVPKDMLNMDKNEIDDVWIDFLTEFTKPLSQTHEDDDETDPEYNAAVEKEKLDREELRVDPEVNIEMDEVNDLISELIDCQNIWEIQESLISVKKPENQSTSQDQGKKLSIEINDEQETHDASLNTPNNDTQIAILPMESDLNLISQIDSVKVVNKNFTIQTLSFPPTSDNNTRDSPKISGKQTKTRKISERLDKNTFIKKVHQHQLAKIEKVEDGKIDFRLNQIELLSQQIRQHVQLLAQGYLQLYGHSEWWHFASKQKELLLELKEKVNNKPNSVINVENLEPAINVCNEWEQLFMKNPEKADKIFEHNKVMFERMRLYRKNRASYAPKFSREYFDFVGNTNGVFLYPSLLPKMPFRPSKNSRKFLPSEDRLIALGLEQFYFFIADNNLHRKTICFVDYLKVSELIAKYTMYAKSPISLQNYIKNQRIPSKNLKGINPIRYFYDNFEAPETKHVVHDYDINKKVKEFSAQELPKCFQLAFNLVPIAPRKKTSEIDKKVEPIQIAPNKLVIAPKPNFGVVPKTSLAPKGTHDAEIQLIDKNKFKVNVPTLQAYAKIIRKKQATEQAKQAIEDQKNSEETLKKLRQRKDNTSNIDKGDKITPRKKATNTRKQKLIARDTEETILTVDENTIPQKKTTTKPRKQKQITNSTEKTILTVDENIITQKKPARKPRQQKNKPEQKTDTAVVIPAIDFITPVKDVRKKIAIPATPTSFVPILPKNTQQKSTADQPIFILQQPKQPNIITPSKVISILPKGIPISDNELVQILTTNNSLYITQQNGQTLLNILPQPIKYEVKYENTEDSELNNVSAFYDEITIEDTPLKVEADGSISKFCKEEIDSLNVIPNSQSNSIKINPYYKVDNSIVIKRELLHLINIIKKIKISNLDNIHNDFIMLPSMPNLCTPSKSTDIDVSFTPNPSNNTLDPSNYQINVVPTNGKPLTKEPLSLDSVGKTKLALTNIQKSKTIPKAQRELEVNQAMFVGNDQISDDQKTFQYARAYFHKIRSRLLNQGNDLEGSKYEELKNIFNSHNSDVESPCVLYKKVEKALGEEHSDLLDDFLTFLTPGQAAEVGRFMDYFQMNSMSEFFEKLQVYFAKKPAQIKKITETLQKLIESSDANNETISSDTIKFAILPYIKANQYLVDWFLRLFPEEKPPDSFSKHGYEVLDVGKLSKENEMPVLDHEILNIPAEETGANEECLCTCHNVPDDKIKKKSRHCVSCGMKYLQGRIYVQNGKTLRPAHVTWEPGSADPGRLLSSETPRLARKRTNSFDPAISTAQNRGDSDDERLSPKRPLKQMRTPNNKPKLKVQNNSKIPTKTEAKTTDKITIPEITEADGDNKNTEQKSCKSENDVKSQIDELKTEPEDTLWTREEDKKILVALQKDSENESSLEKICRLLPHRSEEEISDRLQHVMKLLQRIIGDK